LKVVNHPALIALFAHSKAAAKQAIIYMLEYQLAIAVGARIITIGIIQFLTLVPRFSHDCSFRYQRGLRLTALAICPCLSEPSF